MAAHPLSSLPGQSIANLLSQAAECLQSILTLTSSDFLTGEEEDRRKVFEAKAQEWFANLHEVQMGLRSAVKNLRRAQLPPVVHDASSKTPSGMASATSGGSATRGHNLALDLPESAAVNAAASPSSSRLMHAFVDVGPHGPEIQSASSVDYAEESKLSLSALRLQEAGWRQLADSLQDLAVTKRALSSESGSSDGTVLPTPSRRRKSKTSHRERQQVRRLIQGLVQARDSQDDRLLLALCQLNVQVLGGPAEDASGLAPDVVVAGSRLSA